MNPKSQLYRTPPPPPSSQSEHTARRKIPSVDINTKVQARRKSRRHVELSVLPQKKPMPLPPFPIFRFLLASYSNVVSSFFSGTHVSILCYLHGAYQVIRPGSVHSAANHATTQPPNHPEALHGQRHENYVKLK